MSDLAVCLYAVLFLVIHYYLFGKTSKLQQFIKNNCRFYESLSDLGSVGNIGTAIRVLIVLTIVVGIRYSIEFIARQIQSVLNILFS